MDYKQSLDYLEGLGRFGINLGLARIEKLLEIMGHPERQFKTIHITGTNGKGSTTAMLASILKSAGITTGMYTSPHLNEYTERMNINGEDISRGDFAACIAHVKGYADKITEAGVEHPTAFEVLTAAAFYYFALKRVEYAVIEVGLGGLLDSTNVIIPELSIITNVTLEHTDRCGHTLTEIAHHKAGIIKAEIPVLTAAQGEALQVIKKVAEQKQSVIYVWGRDFEGSYDSKTVEGQQLTFTIDALRFKETFILSLLGRHQLMNCGLAVMAARLLGQKNEKITPRAMAEGLKKAQWPGRFEVFEGEPTIIIDGAHNPDGARVLRENLDLYYGDKRKVFLLGILRDKNVKGIIDELIRLEDIVVVTAPASDRAADPAFVAEKIKAQQVETVKSIEEGILRAKVLAGEDKVVCVAGSLYLIGQVRQHILK